MKKTEKIEVRLSHEEKTALSTVAEQEGRSVSDLVRGLIERYISINTTRLPRKAPWLLLGAIGVAGFFAGHLATYFIAKSHNHHSPIYNMSVDVGSDGVSFPLLDKVGETAESIIPSNDGDIRVTAKVIKNPESLSTAQINLCREEDGNCKTFAEPLLKFNPNLQSAINFKDQNGQDIYIRLSPTLPARK